MLSLEVMMMLILSAVALSSLVGALALGGRLVVLLRRFTPRSLPHLSTKLEDLPTVSVCIPARNETHAMTQCLERVVASTYPKLEIIVLDDSSVDNTSILIKSFAHAGVRFVEGSPLLDGWLGKTHAQQGLYKEASGEYILFLDVDTHISPQSIDHIVAAALAEDAKMVAVLPTRDDSWRASVLFATLRHFWSVIMHRRKRPAVTSSAWFIQKQLLADTYNGFEGLRSSVSPESIIATYTAMNHRYRFFISTNDMGVSYEKKWKSQCETSIRLLYPFFGGSALRALAALGSLLLLLAPFIIVTWSAAASSWTLESAIALAASFVLLIIYMIYTARVWRSGWIVAGLLLPIILIQEIALLVQSMYAYATHTVTWKGRPITQTARSAAEGK